MAIVRCKECGNKISNMAENCPNCGYPIKKIKNTKFVIIMSFLIFFTGLLITMFSNVIDNANNISSINTDSNYYNTYSIENIKYSVPKEFSLINENNQHKFWIDDKALLLVSGFYNDSGYKFDGNERETWYYGAISTVIADDSITPKIENVKINNIIWKKATYTQQNIEVIMFVLLDEKSEYYYAISLSQPDNVTAEFEIFLNNVMNSISFTSLDYSVNKNNITNKRITKENYDKIKEGMSKEDIISILGEPTSISEIENSFTGTMELYSFQEILSLETIDVWFLNGSVYMKNWSKL